MPSYVVTVSGRSSIPLARVTRVESMLLRQAKSTQSQRGLGVRIRNALVGIALLPLVAAAVAFVSFGIVE